MECLIAYDPPSLVLKNINNEIPISIASTFNNTKMVEYITQVMKNQVTTPLFEVLYLKYVETEENQVQTSNEVIEMLCKRIQDLEFIQQGESFDPNEEDEGE